VSDSEEPKVEPRGIPVCGRCRRMLFPQSNPGPCQYCWVVDNAERLLRIEAAAREVVSLTSEGCDPILRRTIRELREALDGPSPDEKVKP
jgi:hypothetical protein